MKWLINIIILAAGNSSRMKSKTSKILHKIGNFPIIEHIIYTSTLIKPDNMVVVIDANIKDSIDKIISKYTTNFMLISQIDKLGTGYATKLALQAMPSKQNEIIVILYGDTPFISNHTIDKMLNYLCNSDKSIIVLAFESSDEEYGKIIVEDNENVTAIIEKVDQKIKIKSLSNSGIVITYRRILDDLIKRIINTNNSEEYYLTDIISIANKQKLKIGFIKTDEEEAIGINNKRDIAKAEFFFQQKKRSYYMESGVTLLSPEHTFFSLDTTIATDSLLHPYVIFGPGVKIGHGVVILPHSYLTDCVVENSSTIGPFAHIKGNSVIGNHCKIGNFVEINKSLINERNNIKHLSYIGNCNIGSNNNIGAGTVVCNYDKNRKKHTTTIGENCFIGANSTLISPLNIDNNAIVAAGSTIVSDIPENTLAIGRERQLNKTSYNVSNKENNPRNNKK